MRANDFDGEYKTKMIQAYPVIAEMTADEFFYSMPNERDAAFERILNARNLRVTHEQYLADKASAACAPTCSLCQRERTLDDAYDYHPIQAITGKPLGWYSGDDGEVCPECMTKTLRGGA